MTVQDNTGVIALIAAYNEAERIEATLTGLQHAFTGASLWVADDGSDDRTAAIAEACGATVARTASKAGKGAAMTLAARRALAASDGDGEEVVLLCDGDLGESAVRLAPLVQAVRDGHADLAVAAFSRQLGGGFGLLVAFARWAIRQRCGLATAAPLSGQRALSADALSRLLPFATGYGMEVGITIDAARRGLRVREIELDLSHRVTARTAAGFLHRGRQLFDVARVYGARR